MTDKKSKKQILLSENISLDDNSSNKHVLLVGGTEDKRRYSYIAPNILNTDAPVIVTDRDGILYRCCGWSLKDKGYNVKLLDPAGIVEKDEHIITDPSAALYNRAGSYNPLSRWYYCHRNIQ